MSPETTPLLSVHNLAKSFSVGGVWFGWRVKPLSAVAGVDLSVQPGETLGIVGESGSGKSTLAQLIVRLVDPTAGSIHFDGADITRLTGRALKPVRRQLQIVFQDPASSLNPRKTVSEIIGTGLVIHQIGSARERHEMVLDILARVGLPATAAARTPREFSGGQRQRIAIARALVLQPKLVILDEPVSALDVSIRSQVLNLLSELQTTSGLTYVLIGHDLAVVAYLADRIAVMYMGQIVEIARAPELCQEPVHPYTTALLSAVPSLRPHSQSPRLPLPGEMPSPLDPPSGCRFRTRCPIAQEICITEVPRLRDVSVTRSVACHFAESSQERLSQLKQGLATSRASSARRGISPVTSGPHSA